jgi:enterobactin synthetase component D
MNDIKLIVPGQVATPIRMTSTSPFPSSAISYCATDVFPPVFDDSWFRQYDIELPHLVASSVLKRRKDFFFGRLCAREAVRQLKRDFIAQIPIGPGGYPIFPDGIEGSISHGGDYAVAVCQSAEFGRVGIDLEPLMTLATAAEVGPLIAGRNEVDLIDWADTCEPLRLTLIFSAKEALFKAMYPDIRRIVDFSCASLVGVDRMAGRMLLTLEDDLGAPWNTGRQIEAQFDVHVDKVVTLALPSHGGAPDRWFSPGIHGRKG